ncbi:Modular serine protease, partial [Eumeta japonica]
MLIDLAQVSPIAKLNRKTYHGSTIPCMDFAFRCIYGACIEGDAEGNGLQDCADNSDELIRLHKGTRISSAGNEMQCLASKECIDLTLLCNGIKNCRDGSDESIEVCINYICNPFGFGFQCGNGACVSGDAKCNGKTECADGSDEAWALCNTPRKKNNLVTQKPTPKPSTPTPKPTTTIDTTTGATLIE